METHQQTSPTTRRLSPGVRCLRGLIRAYQITLSPLMGAHCRFEPTCSSFALEALQVHGLARGTKLGVMRLCRCHPWHPGGFDPVPPASSINNHDGTHTR